MNVIDFVIGLTLVNALPHYILGVWKQPMLSGFGMGNTKNIIWGVVNLVTSVVLFLYTYGLDGFLQNGMYAGGLLIVVTFFITASFWRDRFVK